MIAAPDQASVWVRLETPAAMFAPSADLLSPQARLKSGIDDLLLQLRAQRLTRIRNVTVLLPAAEITDSTGQRLAQAVRRYCELRLRENELSRRVARRDGVAAFGIGIVLFGFGLWLSTVFSAKDLPTTVQQLLGNGVFLVIAWVGLWYPLDTLVFTGQPLKREQRALITLSRARLDVVPDPTPGGPDWLSGPLPARVGPA
ncbi:MAG: hypothetical protein ACRDRJ_29115 [Streptosporangiaceae bacterium]